MVESEEFEWIKLKNMAKDLKMTDNFWVEMIKLGIMFMVGLILGSLLIVY